MMERFVPVGQASLLDDAPGWSGDGTTRSSTNNSSDDDTKKNKGPICWKCRGSGLGKSTKKRRRKETSSCQTSTSTTMVPQPSQLQEACSVCFGIGHLPPKRQEVEALQHCPGEITRARQCQLHWKPRGPLPYALEHIQQLCSAGVESASHNQVQALRLVTLAETSQREIPVILQEEKEGNKSNGPRRENADTMTTVAPFHIQEPLPTWLPQRGEQLCNLVGRWRILQRIASHRWTTDDLVTSYMAGQQVMMLQSHSFNNNFRYLDLGCGNGSVLLMTTWQLLTKLLQQQQQQQDESNSKINKTLHPPLICTGIEARKEAVQLARRSIAFNLGGSSNNDGSNNKDHHPMVDIQVHHGDFRSILKSILDSHNSSSNHLGKYDLVTGTPPYFRVDFTVGVNDDKKIETNTPTTQQHQTNDDSNNKKRERIVQRAVIQQGGMPTCKQSAPARCEFRGGIEAYCHAAAMAMHTTSIFCVCENWINNERVYQAAQESRLIVVQVLPVQGRTGKPNPLFAVYVMRKADYFAGQNNNVPPPPTEVLDCLVVRDDQGNWTKEYQEVLHAMSIPVMPA